MKKGGLEAGAGLGARARHRRSRRGDARRASGSALAKPVTTLAVRAAEDEEVRARPATEQVVPGSAHDPVGAASAGEPESPRTRGRDRHGSRPVSRPRRRRRAVQSRRSSPDSLSCDGAAAPSKSSDSVTELDSADDVPRVGNLVGILAAAQPARTALDQAEVRDRDPRPSRRLGEVHAPDYRADTMSPWFSTRAPRRLFRSPRRHRPHMGRAKRPRCDPNVHGPTHASPPTWTACPCPTMLGRPHRPGWSPALISVLPGTFWLPICTPPRPPEIRPSLRSCSLSPRQRPPHPSPNEWSPAFSSLPELRYADGGAAVRRDVENLAGGAEPMTCAPSPLNKAVVLAPITEPRM